MISSDAHPDSVAAGSPMTNANVFSRLLFTWFSPLTATGYRKPLEEPDLFPMGEALSARTMNDAFEADFRAAVATWRAKHPGTKVVPSSVTARALIKSFGRLSALGGLCKFIGDMCGIAIPILIKEVLSMVERCQQRNAAELSNTVSEGTPYCNVGLGYTLVVLIFLFQVSTSLLTHAFWHLTLLTGLRVRNALITATFSKTLRLSNAARNGEFNTGKVINIVSTDTNRLDQCQPQIHNLWTSFVLVVITMSVMVSYVGWPGLVGIGFMVAFLPVQSGVMTFIGRMRRASQAVTDKRIKLINELLQGIKVVKLLGWEKPSLEGIKKHREDELYYVTRVAVWKSGVIGLAHGVPAIAIVLVFSIYAIIPGNTLIPSLVFGSLSLLNLVRIPLYLIPLSYGYLVDANVSLRRITNLLTADEVDGLPTVFDSQNPELPAIQIKACSFTWDRFDDEVAPAVGPLLNESPKPKPGDDEGDSLVLTEEAGDGLHHAPSSNKNYLSDMNLTISKGELVAVVGKVGAGKSSLLSALVGEMQRVAGEVVFDGSVAYCPQVPWIQNARLRDNVLFGATYDPKRYGEAIYLSALQKDLERLPGGDQIEIGERGINLSGGQKARTNLARAIYSGSSIYLLDDILAAVDAHVAAFLFHACIKGHLRNTTRVMVTHSLAYAAQCDRVLVMADGKVAESGTVDELMALGGVGAALFAEYASGKDGGAREDAGDADLVTEIAGDVKDWDYNGEAQRDPGQPASDATNTNARLIKAEERERGAVRLEHYYQYALYAGGAGPVSVIVLLIVLTIASRAINDIWLAWWVQDQFHMSLYAYLWVFVALGITQAILSVVSNVAFVFAGVQASRRMFYAAVGRLAYAPLSFYEATPIGQVLARLSKDVDSTDNLLYDSFRMVVRTTLTLASVYAVMLVTAPWMGIALVVLVCLYYMIQNYYRATNRELKRLEALTRSPMYAMFGEAMSGLTTIRAYGSQERFRAANFAFVDRNSAPYFLQFTAARWLGVRLEFLGSFITFMVALLGMISRNTISQSLLGLTLSYGLQVTMLMNNNVFQVAEAESQMNAVERLTYYADQLPQERGSPGDIKDQLKQPGGTAKEELAVPADWPSRGEIALDNLQLAYANGVPVLRGITVTIPAGARVAVVGRTGAGKSSMISALMRLVEPNGGAALIDGINIQDISLFDLRSRIAIIPQDPVLFEGTIRSNLDRFDQFEDKDVWAVLDRSGLGDMVRGLELRLEAPVSENGENFSLGERCCLCLARAMLGDKRILIMDEASASIDLETEKTITDSIREHFAGITILTVAHRLHTVIDYDRVMVLDHGKVVEYASPAELLRRPESIFKGLVDETGPASAALLNRLAIEAEASLLA